MHVRPIANLLEYPHTCGKCLVQAIHLQGLTSHVCEINLAIYETSTFLGYFGTSLQVYWLDLDYLDTAAAALRCSALLSALQYLEEWSLDAQDAIMLPQSVVKQGQEVVYVSFKRFFCASSKDFAKIMPLRYHRADTDCV